MAEREQSAVAVGVVDAEAALGDRVFIAEDGEGGGEACVADSGADRVAAGEFAEAVRSEDVTQQALAEGSAEQAGFVVVGFCGEEGVGLGEIEEGFVLFEEFVAHVAVEDISIAEFLDGCGGAAAE